MTGRVTAMPDDSKTTASERPKERLAARKPLNLDWREDVGVPHLSESDNTTLYQREVTVAELLETATSQNDLDFYTRGLMARASGIIRELIDELNEARDVYED